MEADIETIYRTFYEERAKRLSNITLTSEYKIVGFFLFAIIQRAITTSGGIEILIKDGNYEATIPLLRVLLDCPLLVRASMLVTHQPSFCKSILAGKHLNDLKDKNGKNLSDSGVVRSFDNLGWVIGVHDLYKVLNKHVHFSPAHLKLIFDEHKQIVLGERMIARNQEQIDSISEQYQAITKVLIHILDLSLDDLEQHQQ
ncbi:MAG: hypothetical protein EGR83_12390 [Bacteroides cellulosilyticus]|jgi:hypothetical protein|nr:hypothetical protein [Bacteroides cellulosilyticus]